MGHSKCRVGVRTRGESVSCSYFAQLAWLLLFAGLLLTLLSIRPSSASELAPSELRIMRDVQFLASDDLEGRGSGDIGLEVAADYVKDQFLAAGLTLPKHDDDGFLEFNINRRATLGSPNKVTLSDTAGWSEELRLNQNFIPISLGSSGRFSGVVVFAGYAIDAPALGYSDFENIDLAGKVALVLRKAPRQDQAVGPTPFLDEKGVLLPEYASFKSKIEQLAARGAVAIIFFNESHALSKQKERAQVEIETVREQLNADLTTPERRERLQAKLNDLTEKLHAGQYDDLVRYGYGGSNSEFKIPVLQMKASLAQKLFDRSGAGDLDEIQASIETHLQPRSKDLRGVRVEGEISLNSAQAQVKNVIAVLEGEGPLADESIIIGAHYDHVGLGEFGSLTNSRGDIHNGADDNASGTALLMELARKLAARPEKLPRRLIFIGFAAEEMGLLGSKAYCNQPLYPANKTIAMLNFDMVGRLSDNRVVAFGTKTSSRWDALLDELENRHELHVVRQTPGRGPSDHQSFYEIGIPVLHFFTGIHGDYHTPADDVEKINTSGIDLLVDMLADAIVQTASQTERPDYRKTSGSANPLNAVGGYPFLGTIHDRTFAGPGYRVQQVIADSPALRAGLQPADVITAIGTQQVTTPLEFSRALKQYSNTSTIALTVLRGDETLKLSAKLQANPN